MSNDLRCLVYFAERTTKKTAKGQNKLCSTAYRRNKCRCENCKKFHSWWGINYTKNNPEKRKQYYLKYRKDNPDKMKQYYHKYFKTHPEKMRQIWRNTERKRRAAIKKNGFDKYTEKEVIELYGDNCYLCGLKIDLSASRRVGVKGWKKGLHIEHVIDIALGGPDTLANVRPSHAICNLTKKPREMV